MLRNSDNMWVRDTRRLKEMAVDFFKELHNSVGPRNFEPVLQQCPKLVPAEINQSLTAELMMEEVRTAVFQMGSQKAPGRMVYMANFIKILGGR